jgi:hypothetical protein
MARTDVRAPALSAANTANNKMSLRKLFFHISPRSCALRALAFSLLLAGCGSGIGVTKLDESNRAPKGIPWNLAMTQFELTITRQVAKCGPAASAFVGNVEVKITPKKMLDEDQRYVLYSNGWYSTSDIKSKLAPDGTSIGLNAQSENKSSAIVSNVVGFFAKVAAIAAAAAPGAPIPPNVCSQEIVAALAELNPPEPLPSLKAHLKDKTKQLTDATSKVTLLTAQAKLANSYEGDLAKALGEQAKAQKELSDLQTRFDADIKAITDTQTVRWPIRANQFRTDEPYTISVDTLNNWFSKQANPPNEEVIAAAKAKATRDLSLYIALYQQDAQGAWVAPRISPGSDTTVGVPIRVAKIGRLLACIKQPNSAEPACPLTLDRQYQDDGFHKSSDQVVLQLGQIYSIPVTGGAFRSQVSNIEVDEETALPTSIEVAEKVAGAESMTGSAKDTASQIAALRGELADALKAKADLAAAKANAQMANEKSIIDAQTALIKSQTALKEAETARAAADKVAQP